MQTFLPYADYAETAKVLDPDRLGNQAYNECKVLINQLMYYPDGRRSLMTGKWSNGRSRHPACKMWKGHEGALARYALVLLQELADRGYDYPKWVKFYNDIIDECTAEQCADPDWLGNEEVHASHRANLLRKRPKWYAQFGWTEEPREGYVWPVE